MYQMNQLLPTSVDVAKAIRGRCRALKAAGIKLTVKQVFAEAGLSYRTYKSWRGGRCHPRPNTANRVDGILKKYEDAASGGICNVTE
jgi:hypothetical protein